MATRISNQSRTRSGCKCCRERRVKCPEQRPTCRNCERLGFNCCYEITLNWLPVDTIKNHIGDTNERRQCCESVPVEKWMFLATTPHDFDSDAESSMQRPDEISCYPISSMIESAFPLHEDQARRHSCNTILPLRYVSSSSMSSDEGYLWTYFDECITPQCVINPRFNPYRDIVLRIAAISPDGPLLHCVLAVAANQLYSIGLARYKSIMWLHRAKALHLLRARVKDASFGTEAWPYDQIEEGQIIASTLMLCFFEILHDCSESWRIHTDFAHDFLSSASSHLNLGSSEQQQLHQFALAYIHSHNVLAATAGTTAGDSDTIHNFCTYADHSTILSLTGCSKKLFRAISEINRLGSLSFVVRRSETADAIEFERGRNSIERELHLQQQMAEYPEDSFEYEMAIVTEIKRLAALLYLYGRVDGASPHEKHMVRLTSEVLSLIPKISLRTNTLLWPLFIVSVLGIRPECDADKKLVLARLAALQKTRQLGNVKKARHVIEDVWKARELRPLEAAKGWSILEGRNQTISLA